MKILNLFLIPTLLVAMIFTSCRKDDMDEIVPSKSSYQVDTVNVNPMLKRIRNLSSDTILISCVEIPLPIDFRQASGNIITINTEQQLDSAFLLPDSLVDFVYPFNALVDSNIVSIAKIEDLAEGIINCSTGQADCSHYDAHILLFYNALNIYSVNKYEYKITYPVTLNVEGNPIVLNNDDDYIPAIGGNPNRPKDADLVYPIKITQFGRTITLNNDNDVCTFYETLEEPCVNKPPHIQFFFNEGAGTPTNCTYLIDYPLDIKLSGNTTNIQTRDDYLNLLNSSSTAYDSISLVYPVTAEKFNNNQTLSFGSGSDICQYLDNCQ